MKKTIIVALFICSFFFLPSAGYGYLQDQLPSAAMKEINDEMMAKYKQRLIRTPEDRTKAMKDLAIEKLANVKTDGLDEKEKLNLAYLLGHAWKKNEAKSMLNGLMESTDTSIARSARLNMIQMLVEEENFPELETNMREYRKRFQSGDSDSSNFSGLWLATRALSSHYYFSGDAQKAYDIVMEELSMLDPKTPHFSFHLLGDALPIFLKLGKTAELSQMLTSYKASMKEALAEREKNPPVEKAEQSRFKYQTDMLKRFVSSFESTLKHLEIIGKPAPGFNFLHFFNTDPLSLETLRGKVVMIDFWANWCGPCKKAFPSVRKLYDELKPQGFEIIGVTSMQGSFTDGDIREQNITPEKELELTGDLIKRYEMNWPVAFSDRSCYDPEYGVRGVPTFALIDRKGIVRIIMVGAGQEKLLHKFATELLAED